MKEYTPDRLVTYLAKHLETTSKAHLSRVLCMEQKTVNQIASKELPLSGKHLLRIHETSGVSVAYLRDLIGDTSDAPYVPPVGRPFHLYWE